MDELLNIPLSVRPQVSSLFQPHDKVFYGNVVRPKAAEVVCSYGLPRVGVVMKLKDANGEIVVKQADVRSWAEQAQALDDIKTARINALRMAAVERLSGVVKHWGQGCRTPQAMADKLDCCLIAAISKIRSAKHWKLIK